MSLDLPTTRAFVADMQKSLDKGLVPTWKDFLEEFGVVVKVFEKKLGHRLFVYIRHDRSKYLSAAASPFGDAVAKSFDAAAYDIREACRCYALGRDTATVFHLMRVVEKGLEKLANHFSVPFAQENWQNVIEQIESKISALKNLAKGAETLAEQQFFSESAKEFSYFKDAWRNHVMHGRGVYEPEEAEKIFARVRDFMQHLAKRF